MDTAEPLAVLEASSPVEMARGPGTTVLWLNRPDAGNALDGPALAALYQGVEGALADPAVRVIVLAGRGADFCRGLEIDCLLAARAADLDTAARLIAMLRQAVKPVIVRAHGACIGYGLDLAAAASLTVASREAHFANPAVLLGIAPSLSSAATIAAIGARAAQRWLLTGETLDASEAWRLGLAHELCELDELDARINQLLGALLQAAPAATRTTLALLRANATPGSTDDPAIQARQLAECLAGPEAQAGIAAYRNEQAPPWVPAYLGEAQG